MNATSIFDTALAANAIDSVRVVDGQHRIIEVTWRVGQRRGRRDTVDLSPLINTHKFYAPGRATCSESCSPG
jgi:hypothetical protein